MKKRAPGYKVKRAAQVVAYFAQRNGGQINVSKLVNLVYLADRESLRRYDYPILYDCLVSTDHGPIDAITFNYINGLENSETWDRYVISRDGHKVGIIDRDITLADLDQLSRADME